MTFHKTLKKLTLADKDGLHYVSSVLSIDRSIEYGRLCEIIRMALLISDYFRPPVTRWSLWLQVKRSQLTRHYTVLIIRELHFLQNVNLYLKVPLTLNPVEMKCPFPTVTKIRKANY